MADRLIRVIPGGRAIVQGVSNQGAGQFEAVQARNDILSYQIDYTRWLEGDTIASSLVETTGVTVATTENTSTLYLVVSGVSVEGSATIAITSADGRVKEIVVNFREARLDD